MDGVWPIPLDKQLGFSLYRAFMAISRVYRPFLEEIGLTYPQYLVLSALWEEDYQTISGIAARLDLEPSTITPLVKRMEVAGHVVRQRNPCDERQLRVFLTDRGRAIRAETKDIADTLCAKSGMTADELVDLNAKVKSLRDAFRSA